MRRKLDNPTNLLKNPDILFKLALAGFLAVLLNESTDYPEHSRLFPQIVTMFGLIIVAVSLGRDVVAGADKKEKTAGSEPFATARFFKTVLVIVGAFLFALAGGILFVVPAAYLGYFAFFGRREIASKIVVITVAVTLAAYGVFKILFKIPVLNF